MNTPHVRADHSKVLFFVRAEFLQLIDREFVTCIYILDDSIHFISISVDCSYSSVFPKLANAHPPKDGLVEAFDNGEYIVNDAQNNQHISFGVTVGAKDELAALNLSTQSINIDKWIEM